jgi:hypothetical protein
MVRRPKHSKNEVVAPKEEGQEESLIPHLLQNSRTHNCELYNM